MSLKITRPTKNFDKPFTTDLIHEFSNFLSENGMEPDPKKGLVTDGSVGRAYINVGGKRKFCGWYQLWLGQSVPFGRLGDYRYSADSPTATWKPENKKKYTLTKEAKAEIEALRKEAEVKQQEKYFGHLDVVLLFVKSHLRLLVVLMKVFSVIWKRLIYVGD